MKKIDPGDMFLFTLLVCVVVSVLLVVIALLIETGVQNFSLFVIYILGSFVVLYGWFWGVPYVWNKIVDM